MFKILKNPNTSAKELGKAVEDTINYYKERAERLQELNNELREHAKEYVDNELKEQNEHLRQRLALSYGEFASKKEQDAYRKFVNKHIHDRETSRYNGGRAPYIIPNETGLGCILRVKCQICGEEEDITDTGAW